MNTKHSKRLRKEARESTPSLPWINYEGIKGVNKYRMPYVQVILTECQKAVYKALKKEYKVK
jgi:hypothetical protein